MTSRVHRTRVIAIVGAVVISLLVVSRVGAPAGADTPYPIGTPSASDVSGYALPSPTALAGYTETYATNFTGSTLPVDWDTYSGPPGGDPDNIFSPTSVSVSNNLLTLTAQQNASINPSSAGDNWVTGGVCLCGRKGQTYGAFFYRSRVTGAGPTTVGLLWPDADVWPPEIDFNETASGASTRTTASVHYGTTNHVVVRDLTINMTQWHTWGVIWTPTVIAFTVDGEIWGEDTDVSTIPDIAMHLAIQQQTFCGATPVHACPTSSQSTLVDWVAQYAPTSAATTPSVGTGGAGSTTWSATPLASTRSTGSTSIPFGVDPSSDPTGDDVGYAYASGTALSTTTGTATFHSLSSGAELLMNEPSPPQGAGPSGAQTTAATSATVSAVITDGGPPGDVVTPDGPILDTSGNGASDSFELTPTAVGDAYVLAVRIKSATATVASVTGGDATWTKVTSYLDATDGQDLELWLGVITSVAPDPLIVTPSTSGVTASLVVQELGDTSASTTTTTTTSTTSTSTPVPTTTTVPVTSTTQSNGANQTPPPGRATIVAARISTAQAVLTWSASGGPVTSLTATLYGEAGCHGGVQRQRIPNGVERVSAHEVRFSRLASGRASAHSFSPTRTFFARIVSLRGPGGRGVASRCVRVGRP